MDTFFKRKPLFDIHETRAGEPLDDALKDIAQCSSAQTQNFKFNKLRRQYNDTKIHTKFTEETDRESIDHYQSYK